MTHYSEDDLILYYYNESPRPGAVERHLDNCAQCAAAYRALAATLMLVTAPDAPPRSEQYGLEVWQRIRRQLPEQDLPWWSAWVRGDRLALTGAVAVLLLAAFAAGRWWTPAGTPSPAIATNATATAAAAPASADAGRQRVLLTSIAEHLDRSERVLTDIVNTKSGDISAEQQWAEDLVAASRLYRQDAADAGEHSAALVLDELERSLLEIVHTPSRASAARLDEIRRRIDAASLLFKVRVLGDELRRRESQDAPRPRALAAQTS